MKFTTAISIAVAVAPALAIPPPEFGFPDSGNHTELSVAFTFKDNTTVVQEGQLFGLNITNTQPNLALNPDLYQSVADYNGKYLILMVDPDAPSPDQPTRRFILHWMAPNVSQSDNPPAPLKGRSLTNSTPNAVPFAPPRPPTNSSAHRYILYAFQQPDDFVVPEAFSSFSATNRSNFNLTEFMSAAKLDRPAAGEYFYASSEENVPGDFIALPGGEYPGGNGQAIVEGGGSSSGSGSATATTMTESSTATNSAAASRSAAVTETGGQGSSEPGVTGGAGGAGGVANPTASSVNVAAPIATAAGGLSGVVGVGLLGLAAML